MNLHCRVSKDFSIEDGDGNTLTIEQAKQIVDNNELENCNMGFNRLVSMNWDIEALKQFYIDNPG